MRLSLAMATGRVTIEKWAAGHLFGCALGMAANAVGCKLAYSEIEDRWPWIAEPYGADACPFCRHKFYSDKKLMLIAHLFDSHVMGSEDWTLDRLIDFVRQIEPPDPAETPAPQPAEQSLETVR